MSIFNLHANALADYRDFVRSFFTVADDRARHLVLERSNVRNRLGEREMRRRGERDKMRA